jgi:hypothetical protein
LHTHLFISIWLKSFWELLWNAKDPTNVFPLHQTILIMHSIASKRFYKNSWRIKKGFLKWNLIKQLPTSVLHEKIYLENSFCLSPSWVWGVCIWFWWDDWGGSVPNKYTWWWATCWNDTGYCMCSRILYNSHLQKHCFYHFLTMCTQEKRGLIYHLESKEWFSCENISI